jgi:SAM-dependent methyltransferase
MLKIAREKAQRAGLKVDFHQQNIQKLRLSGKYDAVLAMFAVMGYQTTNRAIDATLQSVRRHLKNSGLFIFDVWYGPAVLWEKPEERIKTVREGNVVIIRKARPVLDVNRHMVTVNYMLQKIVDKKAVAEVHESHAMRFFFYQELCYMLEHNGFKVKSITPCMAYKKKPGINDWNITVVAERC